MRKKIQGKTAYVAGWGLLKNEQCFTNNFGPERHMKCRKYYNFQRKTYSGCHKSLSPSSKNKRCKQLLKVIIPHYIMADITQIIHYIKLTCSKLSLLKVLLFQSGDAKRVSSMSWRVNQNTLPKKEKINTLLSKAKCSPWLVRYL